jgi:hypothetical protein
MLRNAVRCVFVLPSKDFDGDRFTPIFLSGKDDAALRERGRAFGKPDSAASARPEIRELSILDVVRDVNGFRRSRRSRCPGHESERRNERRRRHPRIHRFLLPLKLSRGSLLSPSMKRGTSNDGPAFLPPTRSLQLFCEVTKSSMTALRIRSGGRRPWESRKS